MERPNLSRIEVERHIPYNIRDSVKLVGFRGYQYSYNKIGEFDDAIFIVSPKIFEGFNFNTDPSRLKADVAMLQPGEYYYEKGMHHGSSSVPYEALIMSSEGQEVKVMRYGRPPYESIAKYIHIHHGGYHNNVSSEGCQTVPVEQWNDFISLVYRAMAENRQKLVPYILRNYAH